MDDLFALKEALEKPGIGRRKHEIAEQFKGELRVPLKWVRSWISTDWHVIGHNYLWLAAMNACIGRSNTPIHIIYQGLTKTDHDTFNAALEACRGLKVPFAIILWWYNSYHPILRIAAVTACINNSFVPDWFIKHIKSNKDAILQRIIAQI